MGVIWSNNAKSSPGYPAGNEHMKKLAEKASKSYPPPFVDVAQTGSVETPEGNRAVLRGREALADAKRTSRSVGRFAVTSSDHPSKSTINSELGGPEGLFTVFGCHYMRMFADPRLSVLFDTRDDDTNVSALEHGKRVASALLDRWFRTGYFRSLGRGFSAVFRVTPSHQRAKACPMRPKEHQEKRMFTTTQRDAWIGHVMCAVEEVGASEAFQKELGRWLANNMSIYAPFLDDSDSFQPPETSAVGTQI